MSAAARERLRDRVSDDEVVVLDENSAAPTTAEAAWLSRDLHQTPLRARMIAWILASDSIRWVQTYQAGLDDPAYARMLERGVRLTNSNAQAPAIAEYVLAHMLSVLHPIEAQRAAQAERLWRKVPFEEIAGRRVLLVGYGAIGKEIAARLQPFGVHLAVVRREPSADGFETHRLEDLPVLLPNADVVILACALNAQTVRLADAAFFAALKLGCLFINIARGGLVDEEDLRISLDHKRPGFAVLDVFETEPLQPDSWLWGHPRVRVSAHGANAGHGVAARGDALFLDNLRRFIAGAALLNEVR